MAMGLSLLLTGCSEINSSMADSMIDRIPYWAGGLPADAPPRATDPKYHDYVEKLEGKAAVAAPKAAVAAPKAAADAPKAAADAKADVGAATQPQP
jgi:hypothetical protein